MGKPRGQGRYAALRLAVAGSRTVQLSILLAGVLLAWGTGAYALDPALDVSQYAHTAWKIRDGFANGVILSVAQTPDGYLWVGTEYGLLRFDGVRAVPWQPPTGEQLPNNRIASLLTARDGTLWIATLKGLASWKDGKLTQYPEVAGQIADSLLQDRQGTVWFGVYDPGRVCAVQGGKVKCDGAGTLGRGVSALYEDRKGNLWVSTDNRLWRWAPGFPEHYTFPRGVLETSSIIEDDGGALLLATNNGLKRLVNGTIEGHVLPGIAGQFRPNFLFRSSDGSLWIGSHQGLFHLHQGRVDRFASVDGLSGDFISRIFEDREGNVWVGTQDGLDRFRDFAVPTISRNQGLPNSTTWSVQATPDGSIWIGTPDGLTRWENGHMTVYRSRKTLGQSQRTGERDLSVRNIRGAVTEIADTGLTGTPQSLGEDDRRRLWVSTSEGVFHFEGGRFLRVPGVPAGRGVMSIAGDGHRNVWILDSTPALFHVISQGDVQHVPSSVFGQRWVRALLPDRLQDGLWLGFYQGGLDYVKDSQVRASYNAADGLGHGRVNGLRFGSRGTLWAATEGGLSRIKDGHIATLTSRNGLPCDEVHWSMEDDDHAVWLFMPCGLVRIERSELDGWASDARRAVQVATFDSSNGVRSVGAYGGTGPHVAKSPDGRIWFITLDGVSVIDPHHLPINKIPPPVHIEQIIADRKTYWQNLYGDASSSPPRLPPLVRDLTIDYTGLSLVVPGKVRFRVKLEGWDGDWQDAGIRRQSFYTNLAPRKYRFRVMACNNSGVWNEAGDTLDFSIAPAYYQTNWFRAACVAAFMVLLWVLYQLRLRQLAREFNAGLEARVNERTRIARELHDSLLQGVQGLMFRLQAVRDMLPGRAPAEAIEALDIALERGDKAILEGRDTVSDLRESLVGDGDIAKALTALGEELAAQSDNGSVPCVRVLVEGKQRELNPILRDEIYRIGREALRNAFRHARAQKIEAEITYGDSEFLFHVRDDGIGLAPALADQGSRAGHWGLPGMRERAKSFGGKLEVWSEHGAGTEIELSVPGAIAYGKSEPPRRFWLWRKKIGESDGQQS
jgi:signal transduction histidine kinase/ligand-binding sensor domain-containing protein